MLGEIFHLDKDLMKQTSQGSQEYFDIGLPMDEPFAPAGTVLILLEHSFPHRNNKIFQWGCIPDSGGVEFGYLPYIPAGEHESIRLNYPQFTKVLEQVGVLPEKCIQEVLYKKKSEDFCSALRGIVKDEVIDGMLDQPMQSARRIEFCLKGTIETRDTDVRYVLVPNTYKEIFPRSQAKISLSKIIYYNPKITVIDWLKTHEIGCYWRV